MAEVFKVTVEGLPKLKEALERVGKNSVKIMASELHKEAEALMTEAKQETPVDTGALRASGHVKVPQTDNDSAVVVCGFGGPAAGYAVIVHENLEANHPTGKAKFLEDPFNRRLRGFAERIGDGMKARLGELK
jgi:hypothetical protein